MSTPAFDWGAVVNAIQEALGTVIEQIATAIKNNASVIGAVIVGMGVVGLAFALVNRYFPAISGLLGRLGA
jgi:threonine dehydrogenase-like Zn-dependent dehydrogenase